MANYVNAIDRQQERHYIGDLLCDEDALSQVPSSHYESGSTNALPTVSILPSSGPLGPSNQNFWPEPPPPYSPATADCPAWASCDHNSSNVLTSSMPGICSPTGTDMAFPDYFKSSNFDSVSSWDRSSRDTIAHYIQSRSAAPYSTNRGIMVMKPPDQLIFPSPGSMDIMHGQYPSPYYTNHQNFLNSRHYIPPENVSCDNGPPNIPFIPANYVNMYENDVLMNSFQVIRGGPQEAYQSSPSNMSSFSFATSDISPKLSQPGKSYRDVASRENRSATISLEMGGTPVPEYANAVGNFSSKPKVCPLLRGDIFDGTSHNTGERVRFGHCDEGSAAVQTNMEANKIDPRAGSSENEFQKITHRKSKGLKHKKKNPLTTDDEGLTATQIVDAPSRFSVLQSLNQQPYGAEVQKKCSEHHAPINSSPSADFIIRGQKKVKYSCVDNSKRIDFLARKESSDNATVELVRGNRRRHRSNSKKQQNSMFYFFCALFSVLLLLLKRSVDWIVDLVTDISLQLRDITIFSVEFAWMGVTQSFFYLFYCLRDRLRLMWNGIWTFLPQKLWNRKELERIEHGLVENIEMPCSTEEALNRLLGCYGKDAYVVLGLRADCSDDDVKHYYKRQTVLVNPDKNHFQGADEAFKILSKAFEAIGTQEARAKYNSTNIHGDLLNKEMEEAWNVLRQKVNEVRNTMHCDCGSKHTRVPMGGVRASEARYCGKCNTQHPAKHNDIWAETRFGGLRWVYFTCLDGIVYDITQWATCSCNQLKHMKANSHLVQYRLISSCNPASNRGNSMCKKNAKRECKHHRHCGGELDFYDDGNGRNGIGCCCSSPFNGVDGIASQQVTFRPPERHGCDVDRPRRAGRCRKMK